MRFIFCYLKEKIFLSMIRIIQQNEGMLCKTNVKPAGSFLLENTNLNHEKTIPFIRTGREEEDIDPGMFNLIIGSDLSIILQINSFSSLKKGEDLLG